MFVSEQVGQTTSTTTQGGSASAHVEAQDATFSSDGEAFSLEAATRLVEPMRFNNLTPEEITAKHLRRARRLVLRARHQFHDIRRESHQVLTQMRAEAQRGQQLARSDPGRQRARQAQQFFRKASSLQTHYDALHEERARFARRIAAARDLLLAWQSAHGDRESRAAHALHLANLAIAREERITRDSLNDIERTLQHLNAAEDAIRRDGETVRLDPVTFRRHTGRMRKRVNIAIVAVVIALIAIIYPPWAPPSLAMGCTEPSTPHGACTDVHAGSGIHIANRGTGVLIGWAAVNVQGDSSATSGQTQYIPLFLLPRGTRTLTCDEVGGCVVGFRESVRVQIFSSGGAYTITVAP
jgi:hypothetical protein